MASVFALVAADKPNIVIVFNDDIGESKNVIAQYPEIADRLKKALEFNPNKGSGKEKKKQSKEKKKK